MKRILFVVAVAVMLVGCEGSRDIERIDVHMIETRLKDIENSLWSLSDQINKIKADVLINQEGFPLPNRKGIVIEDGISCHDSEKLNKIVCVKD